MGRTRARALQGHLEIVQPRGALLRRQRRTRAAGQLPRVATVRLARADAREPLLRPRCRGARARPARSARSQRARGADLARQGARRNELARGARLVRGRDPCRQQRRPPPAPALLRAQRTARAPGARQRLRLHGGERAVARPAPPGVADDGAGARGRPRRHLRRGRQRLPAHRAQRARPHQPRAAGHLVRTRPRVPEGEPGRGHRLLPARVRPRRDAARPALVQHRVGEGARTPPHVLQRARRHRGRTAGIDRHHAPQHRLGLRGVRHDRRQERLPAPHRRPARHQERELRMAQGRHHAPGGTPRVPELRLRLPRALGRVQRLPRGHRGGSRRDSGHDRGRLVLRPLPGPRDGG